MTLAALYIRIVLLICILVKMTFLTDDLSGMFDPRPLTLFYCFVCSPSPHWAQYPNATFNEVKKRNRFDEKISENCIKCIYKSKVIYKFFSWKLVTYKLLFTFYWFWERIYPGMKYQLYLIRSLLFIFLSLPSRIFLVKSLIIFTSSQTFFEKIRAPASCSFLLLFSFRLQLV